MDENIQQENKKEKGFHTLFRSWKEVMQGHFGKFVLILLLLALPVSLVNAYAGNRQFSETTAVLRNTNLSQLNAMTNEEKTDFFASLTQAVSSGLGENLSAVALNILVGLLECAVLVVAILYFYDRSQKTDILGKDLSKTTMWVVRKTVWVYIVQFITSTFTSFVLSSLLLLIIPFALVLNKLTPTLQIIAIIPLTLLFAVVVLFVQAYILAYSYNITVTVALGRIRMMFSMFYTRILLHKKKKFTILLIALGLLAEYLLPLFFSVPAMYLNYTGSEKAILLWGGSAFLAILIWGINMTFYTANFLRLEKEKATDLTRFYNGGMIPPNGENNPGDQDSSGED